jgi:hypothetical protein
MTENSQTSFTLRKINVSKLDKAHIIADMAETSFKTSPKNKKTKIKDVLDEKKIDNTLDDDKADRIIISNGMQRTIFYTTINGEKINADDMLKQIFRCFHCHCDITNDDSFIGIPIKLIEENGEKYFECVGICCDWSCAASHIKLRNLVNDNRFKSSYYLLSQMFYKVFKKYMTKDIASKSLFCYEVLKPYGGSLEKINKKHLSCTSLHKSSVSQTDKVLFSVQPIFYEELKK